MVKREYLGQFACAHEGCRERSLYVYRTRREQADGYARQHKNPWRCTRHTKPDEVMVPGNEQREVVLTATLKHWTDHHGETKPLGLFWTQDDEDSGNGFAFGPGFKAWAKDWPEGARLVVTTRVELPAERD